jgi:rhodanese-related sulfurtransferase
MPKLTSTTLESAAGTNLANKVIIPGAVWRDPEQVEQWSKVLPKERKVIVYCARGGSVSRSVSNRLQEEGVRVSYIEGGIATWKESGGEVESKLAGWGWQP